MLDNADSKYYLDLINKRLVELDELEQQSERSNSVELDQNKVGRLSRMDALQQQAVQDEILARAKRERALLMKAKASIERDDYGRCKVCDATISTGRLQFDPSIELCISCASSNERH